MDWRLVYKIHGDSADFVYSDLHLDMSWKATFIWIPTWISCLDINHLNCYVDLDIHFDP